MAAIASILPDGKRLHLNHGPIDLIVEADNHRAYAAAIRRFETVLQELVAELSTLRTEIPRHGLTLQGAIAKRMARAVQPHWRSRITPMAAVAGAVADEVLAALLNAAPLRRAYVNNGGDIALHLADGETFTIASPTGAIVIRGEDDVRGIATSGWRGRSFSLGIADSVTVLARTASMADAAATLIANAVDLPGSPKVKRQSACDIAPDSDLRERLVTVAVDELTDGEIEAALRRGLVVAEEMTREGLVDSASLMLGAKLKFTNPKIRHSGRGPAAALHRSARTVREPESSFGTTQRFPEAGFRVAGKPVADATDDAALRPSHGMTVAGNITHA